MEPKAVALPGLTSHAGRTPFVGRAAELAFLEQRLEAAARGEGGVVLIHGEAGIGKTRLLEQLAARARDRGWLVLSGRAYDTEGMPPYLPFVEALSEHFRVAEEAQRSRLRRIPQIARLMPEMQEHMDELPAKPADPQAERYLLFENVSRLLLEIASDSESKGLVLCLDDLHWAERSTLLLLQHLARKLRGATLLVAGSYRGGEAGGSHPLYELLAELTRERLCESLALQPLSVEETTALAEAVSGSAPAASLAVSIHSQTDGNPFFVEEVCRQLLSDGYDLARLRVEDVRWSVPEGVLQVIGRRLTRLSQRTQTLLQAASVLGEGFSTALLAPMTGQDAGEIVEGLEEACRAQMVQGVGDAHGFGHALIRQAVYEGMGAPRRQLLHRRAAEAIEARCRDALQPHFASIALHLLRGGDEADRARTIDFCCRAADAATAAAAFEEAMVQLSGALELVEASSPDTARLRMRLLEQFADLTRVTRVQFERGIASLEEALRLAGRAAGAEDVARVHIALGRQLSTSAVPDLAGAMAHFRAAEALLEDGPKEMLARLYQGIAAATSLGLLHEEGMAATNRMLDLAQDLGDRALELDAIYRRGHHLGCMGRIGEGRGIALAVWEQAGPADRELLARAQAFHIGYWIMMSYGWNHDPLAQVQFWESEGQKLSRWQQAAILDLAIFGLLESGRLDEAAALDDGRRRAWAVHALALRRGDWETAARIGAETAEAHERGGFGVEASYVWYYNSLLPFAAGDWHEAERMLRRAIAIATDGKHVCWDIACRAHLAMICAESGRLEEASVHLGRLRAILASGEDWRGRLGQAALAEAVFAAASADFQAAEGHFERALSISRRYGAVWDEAEALHFWGRAYATGRRSGRRAIEKFDAAIAVYQRIGAGEVWLDRVRRDRERVADSGSTAGRPDGLSRREVEVLRLIAAGLSNQQIAEALVLSVRTVERHINHIYAKIDVHSKAQATAYALQRGLIPTN